MPPLTPVSLLEAIAVHVTAQTGIKAAARRAPTPWRDGSDPYVVVTQVGDAAAELRGDGKGLADGMLAQASLFETAAGHDPDRIGTVVAALDGIAVPVYGRGIVRGWRIVPEPNTDDVQTAVDVAYQTAR